VYDSLVCPRSQLGNPSQPLSLTDISHWVKNKAQQAGFLPPENPLASSGSNLQKADEDAIRECVWSLIIQGIVVPGCSNDSSYQANLP
jgi:hypothetical protein